MLFHGHSSGHFERPIRREPRHVMKPNPPKKKYASRMPDPVQPKTPWTFQKFFDKWWLPVLFVAIGGVIGWSLWRG